MVGVAIEKLRAGVRREPVVRDQNWNGRWPFIVTGYRRAEQTQSARRSHSNDPAHIEVIATNLQRVRRRIRRAKLRKVVVRTGPGAPRDALDVRIKRMHRVDIPGGPKRQHVRVRGQRVWPAEQLIVDEPAAVAVAKRFAVAPIAGEIDALP